MASPGGPMPISDRAVVVAQIFYGVCIPLVVLATATLAYRLSRIRKRIESRMNMWSDGCITIGYILTLATCGLYIPQAFLSPGFKPPASMLEGQKGAFLSIPIWGMGMAFIKASVGLTLLRIQSGPVFKSVVWFNVGLAAAYGFGNMWFILFSCQPLSAAWGDFSNPEAAKCLPPSAIKIASVTGAVVSVATDVMLSLAPITFLWNLKRPLRERIVLGCLMGLGLLAGISSILKNLIINDFGKPGVDMWAMNVSISTWTALEMLLGIIAACTPFCKPALEACFSKLGVSITNSKPVTGATPAYAASRYQRADARDTFKSKTGPNTNKSTYESEEDLVGAAVELQQRGNSGIHKQTHIQVHESAIGPEDQEPNPMGEKKYYLAV